MSQFGLILPMIIIIIIVSGDLLPNCQSSKIFFTFFHDGGSHFGSMRPMMEKLVQRGHSVAFLDTISAKEFSASVRHFRAPLPLPKDEAFREMLANRMWNTRNTAPNLVFNYYRMERYFDTLMVEHADKIVKMLNEDWDFIVIDDLFWSFGFAFATLKHRLWELNGRKGNQPHIIVYATAAQSLLSAASTKSLGRNWVSRPPMVPFLPTDSSDVFSPSKFGHRLFGFYEISMEFALIGQFIPSVMTNIAKFGVPNFNWHELYARTSLEFSDSIDRIGWPMAVGKDMLNVGAHCKQPKTLPKEFADFIEGDPESKGTIYIAFGTHADWRYAPERVTSAIFGAFSRLRQFRIIFVFNGSPPSNGTKNILLVKWAPQLEILAHPRTRAFISHGGNKSIREALCAGVPLIVMPIFAEQAHSAHLLLAMGIAPVINKFTLTKDSVFRTINGVVSNPNSVPKARKLKSMFLDRPMGAMEEGIFAMERLLRIQTKTNNSQWAQFTQHRGMHLPWAKFAYFDCILFMAIPIIIILSLK